MKYFILILYFLTLCESRKVTVTVTSMGSGTLNSISEHLCSATDSADVSTGVSSPANEGVALYSSSNGCSLLLDEDNQKTTDFDYMTPSFFEQPTQISTGSTGDSMIGTELCVVDRNGNLNLEVDSGKCMLYNVKVDDEEPSGTNTVQYNGCSVQFKGLGSTVTDNTHSGSKVHLQEIHTIHSIDVPETGNAATSDNARYNPNTKTCHFMPINHKYVGKVEAIVRFTKAAPKQGETDDLQVKIGIKFVPHVARKFGVSFQDQGPLQQHDALVLMSRSNVNNLNNDKCTASDGIDYIGMRRIDNVDLTEEKCLLGDMTTKLDNGDAAPSCDTKVNRFPNENDDFKLNLRSTGDGCVTSGSKAYIFTDSMIGDEESVSLDKSELVPKYTKIKKADGTAVQLRVMGHFIDRRYKVIDQTGVEVLEDNIGDFKIVTQSINVHADYKNVGDTRKNHQTKNLNLKKLNLDDYTVISGSNTASKCLHQADSDANQPGNQLPGNGIITNDLHSLKGRSCYSESSKSWSDYKTSATVNGNIDKHDYAQYYFDHDHILAYRHIKHIQNSYIDKSPNCGSSATACSNTLILAGFERGQNCETNTCTNHVVVKIPIDLEKSIPKAPWNIYIPKLDIQSYGKAEVLKLSSDIRNPTYGLPVLDTRFQPQFKDGYPLSHFFRINGVLDCLAADGTANTNCDEVDSYDDQYELFNRLNIISSNGNLVEYWKEIKNEHGSNDNAILCSSNRVDANGALESPGAFGVGRVRDIGIVYVTGTGDNQRPVGTYITQTQMFMDNCRLRIDENTYFDQIVMSWNNGEPSNDARMCQDDEQTVLVKRSGETDMTKCSDYTPPTAASGRQKNLAYQPKTDTKAEKCNNCVKMTLIDRRRVMIGSTELSLLRRQEVFPGQGVQVQGSSIGFLLGKENSDDTASGVLEFDIWGTSAMQGYTPQAIQCSSDDTEQKADAIGPVCEEQHGCALSAAGTFEGTHDDESLCAEKKVKTPRKDGEFTFHTIRSTSHCNGKLDIQLRLRQSGDDDCVAEGDLSVCKYRKWGDLENLLNGDDSNTFKDGTYPTLPFLRPVYDVRLPCSRITSKTSDSIKLKFKFSLAYDLKEDQYTFDVTGVEELGKGASAIAVQWDDNNKLFKADGNTGKSGFTKAMEFKAYVGTCVSKSTLDSADPSQEIDNGFNAMTESCGGVDFTNVEGSAGLARKVIKGTDCANLGFSDNKDGNVVLSLDEEVSLALVYKRTYSYQVQRDHPLDTNVANTSIDADVQYFCQDQKFKISVNPSKTASVSVVTPIQLIVERQAQVVDILWHGDGESNTGFWEKSWNNGNGDTPFKVCGAQSYQLRILVKLQEQGTHSPNQPSDFKSIQDADFEVSIVSSSDTLYARRVTGNSESYVALVSDCIQITEADCSGALSSQWADFQETSTSLLLQGLDNVLGSGASGTNILSEIDVTTDFESCPVDIEDVQETGEFAVAVSFDVPKTTGDNAQECLQYSGITAKNAASPPEDITNCASGLVTSYGQAAIHSYTVDSGKQLLDDGANPIYVNGALKLDATNAMQISTAKWSLKRFERSFSGDGKGQQLGSTIDLCTYDKSTTPKFAVVGSSSTPPAVPAIPNPVGDDYDLLVQAVSGNDYKCQLGFKAFGEADLLNDVWEIHVEIVMTNSARRLRSSKTLKLKAESAKSADVGFQIVSDTTVVTEQESQQSPVLDLDIERLPVEPSTPSHHETNGDDDHTVLIIFGFIIGGALVAAAVCLLNGSGCKDGYTLLGDDECADKRNVIVVQAAPVKKSAGGVKYRKLRY